MEDFIGREEELRDLNATYSKKWKRTCVVFGRRRIGKSELLLKFCSGKKNLFFNCIQGSESDNLTDEAEETGAILVDMNRLIGRTDLWPVHIRIEKDKKVKRREARGLSVYSSK
jgi:AAA+ ATPase superfamily predicted ATPase